MTHELLPSPLLGICYTMHVLTCEMHLKQQINNVRSTQHTPFDCCRISIYIMPAIVVQDTTRKLEDTNLATVSFVKKM